MATEGFEAAALDLMDVVVVGLDLRGRVILWNAAAERLYELSRESAMGRDAADLCAFEWASPSTECAARASLTATGAWHGRSIHLLSSGEHRHLDASVRALLDSAHQPSGFVAVIRDVTERERAAEALREGEELHRVLFDLGSVGLLYVGPDHRFLKVNDKYCQLTGYTREELLLLTPAAITHPDDRGSQREQLRAFTDGNLDVFTCEKRYIRKDGMVRWVAVTAREVDERASRPRYSVAIVEDITERRQAEDELRKQHSILEAVLEGTSDSVYMKDVAGRYLSINSAGAAMVQLTKAEILGADDFALFPDDVAREIRARDGEVLASGTGITFEEAYYYPNGITYSQTSKNVCRDASGNAIGLVGITRDITTRKQSEERLRELLEELRESDRRKSEFLAVLSHELRNPIAPIRNSLYILDRAAPGTPPHEKAKQVMQRQVDHMARLIDDLLDLNRISHGKITLERSLVDARDVARRASDDIRSVFDQRRIELFTSLPGEPVWIDADSTRVAQMIGNVLSNAAKFTPSGGDVKFVVRAHQGACELRVRDSGEGIDGALLERIFEPFEQAERTLGRAQGGMGIGLALVKKLALLHGGSVCATSDGEGHGAEFMISLPLAAPRVSDAPRAQPGGPHPLRIVIIEDNEDAGESLSDLLRLEGHETHLAQGGHDGIALVRRVNPDVVISDVGLPDMSGYEVIRAIRAGARPSVRPDTRPIFAIALTGYAQVEDRERALDAGFDCHLAKPPAIEVLAQLLQRASKTKGA